MSATASLPITPGHAAGEAGHDPAAVDHLAILKGYGERIRAWQLSQNPPMTDAAMVARYAGLGTTRTFKRVWSGEGIGDLNVKEQAARYEKVWAQIETDAHDVTTDPVYDDLGPATEVRAAWVRLMSQSGLQRLVLVEGDTGTGKTSALVALRDRIGGGSAYLIESHEGWGRLRTALECLAAGLSIRATDGKVAPQSSGDWLELIIDRLNNRGKRVILIDECHHWGGEMLNALKTLINRTQCVFVIAGMKTLLEKLTRAKSEEARQLIYNRLLMRITLGKPQIKDARTYLERRAATKATEAVLKRLCETAGPRGSFAFLRRVAVQLNRLPSDVARGDEEVLDAMTQALDDLGERR